MPSLGCLLVAYIGGIASVFHSFSTQKHLKKIPAFLSTTRDKRQMNAFLVAVIAAGTNSKKAAATVIIFREQLTFQHPANEELHYI